MIVAIDGPAGSGKSTTAREVARRLGFKHLDSGAFYRALTHAALAAGIPPERWDDLSQPEIDALGIEATPRRDGFRMCLRGRDIGTMLRAPVVTAHVSRMAAVPAVREWLLERFRAAARGTDVVADGRDIGTVVFPDAELKVFLVADPEVRARRRLADHGVVDPTAREIQDEVARLAERDRRDSERLVAPLRRAPDAVLIDTSELDFEHQVRTVVELARDRRSAQRAGQPQSEPPRGLDGRGNLP